MQPGCRTGAGRAGGSPPPALGAHDRRVRGTRRHGGGPHASTQAAAARFLAASRPASRLNLVQKWLGHPCVCRPGSPAIPGYARQPSTVGGVRGVQKADGPEHSATSEFVRLTVYDQLLGSPASSIASTRCSL